MRCVGTLSKDFVWVQEDRVWGHVVCEFTRDVERRREESGGVARTTHAVVHLGGGDGHKAPSP